MKNDSKTTINNLPPLHYEIIKEGMNAYAFDQAQFRIIQSDKTFKQIWDSLNQDMPEPLPEIDFNKNMVVFYSYGPFNHGGYTLKLHDVEENENEIILHVFMQSPNPEDFVTEVLTHLYFLVKINRTNKSVKIIKIDKPD